MISDKLFKDLLHNCEGYAMFTADGPLVPGYKPDYALKNGNDFIILESELSTSLACQAWCHHISKNKHLPTFDIV